MIMYVFQKNTLNKQESYESIDPLKRCRKIMFIKS